MRSDNEIILNKVIMIKIAFKYILRDSFDSYIGFSVNFSKVFKLLRMFKV